MNVQDTTESPQQESLTTSTTTADTTSEETSSRFATAATTKRRGAHTATEPKKKTSSELMEKYGATWGVHQGRRVIYIPSKAPDGAAKEIREALDNERK